MVAIVPAFTSALAARISLRRSRRARLGVALGVMATLVGTLAAAPAAHAATAPTARVTAVPVADVPADGFDLPQFTVTVSPGHGPAGSTFQATLAIAANNCHPYGVGFYVAGEVGRGRELAPVATLSHSCRVTVTVTAPASWRPGDHKRIVAAIGGYAPSNEITATFKVDKAQATATPTKRHTTAPTHKPTPSATPSAPAPSDSPSPVTASPPSPQPSLNLPVPVRPAANIGSSGPRGSSGLIITAVAGIVLVALFGGWAALRQGRSARGRT